MIRPCFFIIQRRGNLFLNMSIRIAAASLRTGFAMTVIFVAFSINGMNNPLKVLNCS